MTEKEKIEREKKRLEIAYIQNGLNSRGLPIYENTTNPPEVLNTSEFIPTMDDSGRITANEIINRIEDVKEAFELSQNITNWRKESPSMFTAFCIKVGAEVFENGKKNLLKTNQIESTFANRSRYDIELLESIYDYFTFLCSSYDIPIRIYDFACFKYEGHFCDPHSTQPTATYIHLLSP